jgi:hypothetical protein
MEEHQASRTLLKSPPELWAECSDAQSLRRHLGEFVGEIRITTLEPETTVAWEGDALSGTVVLQPSGWGTKVTLRAKANASESDAAAPAPAPRGREPARARFVARVRRWFYAESGSDQLPVAPAAEPPEAPPEPDQTAEALTAALDSLGKAHHRPFSRA